MKEKRNFHPGWAKRPQSCHRMPFTRELWESWLRELNREPVQKYIDGIAEMRQRLKKFEDEYYD